MRKGSREVRSEGPKESDDVFAVESPLRRRLKRWILSGEVSRG